MKNKPQEFDRKNENENETSFPNITPCTQNKYTFGQVET